MLHVSYLVCWLSQDLRASLHEALELTGAQNREVWKPFWAAQQRFFKLLCISMKVCGSPLVCEKLHTSCCTPC